MPIARIEGSHGRFVDAPGEYLVEINQTSTRKTKSKIKDGKDVGGKPMLVVEFETEDGKTIAGYYAAHVPFHMKNLETLKLACGLKVTDSADNLVGKKCGILVEPQEPNPETGRIFMQIVGYGKASDVSAPGSDFAAPETGEESVPF